MIEQHLLEISDTCARHRVAMDIPLDNEKVGVARNLRTTLLPINGLRHPRELGTSGWFFWAGEELSTATDFFQPLHVSHLEEWRPEVIKYLGLPPGYRFLIAPEFEDVWFDSSLLAI